MKFPKNAAYDLAKRLGASIEWHDGGRIFTINVSAPRGKHWSDGAVHELRVEGCPTSGLDRDNMFVDVLRRMEVGLEDCDLNDQACADYAFDDNQEAT